MNNTIQWTGSETAGTNSIMKQTITTFVTVLIIMTLSYQLVGCGGGGASNSLGAVVTPEPTPEATDLPDATATPDPEATATPVATPVPLTLVGVQETILTPNCAGCHGGANPSANLALDTVENSFAALVNQESGMVAFLLVEPNNPDDSYLVQKIENTAGIVGQRMPIGAPALSAAQISFIRDWINAGAPMGTVAVAKSSAKVSKVNVEENIESIDFQIRFSLPLDQNSVSKDALLLYLTNQLGRQMIDREQYDYRLENNLLNV